MPEAAMEDDMTRIALIDGHPDPDRRHFVHALADAYAEGAARYHEVDRIDVGSLDFPLLRSPDEWRDGQPVPSIADAQRKIRAASHLVLLYPLWLGDVPALFKGFLEQVARPGFAIAQGEGGFPKRLLKGRSARVVVTMGMPSKIYTLFYRAHSLRSLERNILRLAGIGPIRHSIIGNVEGSSAERDAWLKTIRDLGTRAG
jgi:putative NADPH-quinone reductase